MRITSIQINTLLVQEDIEGLIGTGAPMDEYESEAAQIADALDLLAIDEINEETLRAIILLVWAKSFEFNDSELQLRLPAIQRVVQMILSIK